MGGFVEEAVEKWVAEKRPVPIHEEKKRASSVWSKRSPFEGQIHSDLPGQTAFQRRVEVPWTHQSHLVDDLTRRVTMPIKKLSNRSQTDPH